MIYQQRPYRLALQFLAPNLMTYRPTLASAQLQSPLSFTANTRKWLAVTWKKRICSLTRDLRHLRSSRGFHSGCLTWATCRHLLCILLATMAGTEQAINYCWTSLHDQKFEDEHAVLSFYLGSLI